MKHKGIYNIVMICAVVFAACTDKLYEGEDMSSGQDGLQFCISTVEMGDELIAIGRTRAAAEQTDLPVDSSSAAGSKGAVFRKHQLAGDLAYVLNAYSQPLPLVSIHRGAVGSESSELSENSEHSLTRAGANEIVEKSGVNFHDSLTIWGYTDNVTSTTPLFDQILLTKVRNWRNSVEWPYNNGQYMKFYAVAPSLESINMSATGGSFSTAPTLTYTLPDKAGEMRDILYGESDNISIAGGPEGTTTTNPKQEHLGKDNKFVNLHFRHITTAVRFSQGIIPDGLVITNISLQGVYNNGTFTPGTDDDATGTKGKWSGWSSTANYSIDTYFDEGQSTVPAENVYIDGGKVMFMIPQTLPAGATLSITLTETAKSKTHIVSCPINGDIWKKGYTVNYKITIGELEEGYYLTADAVVDIEHSNNPVTSTVGVHSYHLYTDYSSGVGVDAYRAVKWVIDPSGGYSTDGGSNFTTTRPTWLTDFHGVLEGTEFAGGNPATAAFTVAKQEHERSAAHDQVLYNNKGVESTVDLSTQNPDGSAKGTTETANCYIVNRSATTYSFPLVYGNKTSNDVAEAACFKDHTGATITKILIKDQIEAKDEKNNGDGTKSRYYWTAVEDGNKDVPSCLRAVLLWQDVNGLVSSVSSTGTAINFTIGQSTPGNAVIALQAKYLTYTDWNGSSAVSGLVNDDVWHTLWTWHIWMTDEVYKNDGSSDEKTYDSFYINGSTADNLQADHIAQLKNSSGGDVAKILPVNLGWVPDDVNFGLYKPRTVQVKLKQAEGKGDDRETVTVTIKQDARQNLYTGTGTVYQWGRPTAFPATRKIDGTKRTIYDFAGNDITERFEIALASSPGDAISKPFNGLRLEGNANSWFDSSDADYSNAMWNSTKKTVYDPCPPGFRVPPASIFYGFSKKTGNTGSAKTIVSGSGDEAGKMNMYQDVDDLNGMTQRNGAQSKGGYFYLKADETRRYGVNNGVVGGVVYMPATGEFMANKAVGDKIGATDRQANQTYGLYWTSDYFSGNSLGCGLWITPDYSATGGTTNKPVLGFFDEAGHKSTNNYYNALRAIRPMKE